MLLLKQAVAGLRLRLIDDARHAWRFASVRLAGGGAALIAIWNQLPDDIRAHLPAPIAHAAPSVILAAVVFSRVVRQEPAGGR